NFGLRAGLDGHLCGFLGVEHAEVYERFGSAAAMRTLSDGASRGVTPKQDADTDLERICA
ncbi:MAG TPA: hypothetical protein VFT30_10440, partial [Nitrospira sp.]|nr:hypothetical protein [Nitrospira sp.]